MEEMPVNACNEVNILLFYSAGSVLTWRLSSQIVTVTKLPPYAHRIPVTLDVVVILMLCVTSTLVGSVLPNGTRMDCLSTVGHLMVGVH